ncbi:MAG: molybdenum cofactor guanylyltransferase [Planctomycetia bacterium]
MNPSAPSAAIGIVLAGGDSRRMQTEAPAGQERTAPLQPVRKEWLEIGGRTLLDRVVETVAGQTSRTIVVTAPGRPLPPLSQPVEIVHDSRPGSGPLAALLDGLDAIGPAEQEPVVFVSSCDAPGVKPDLVRWLVARALASGADWVVPEVAGHPQVLASVIRRSLRGPIAAWLNSGRRDPRGLVASLRHDAAMRIDLVGEEALVAIDPALESFRDIDTPEDLAAFARQLTSSAGGGGAYTPPP